MPATAELGLRERKKQQTRQAIFDAARRLFAERGFQNVTVAEIARAANVSEVTVFNYFPAKEDIFFAGMQFFEEQLLNAIRLRPRGESAVKAFRRRLLESIDELQSRERIQAIGAAARALSASATLAAREGQIVDRYTRKLAELLATETRAARGDAEPLAVAAAIIGSHRAVVEHVRHEVLSGRRGPSLVQNARAQIMRVSSRLERGLGDYSVRA